MDCLHPGSVNMRKVDFNLRNSYEFISNYKELQKAFDSQSIDKVRGWGPAARQQARAGAGQAVGCWRFLQFCESRVAAAPGQVGCVMRSTGCCRIAPLHGPAVLPRAPPCAGAPPQVFLPEALSKGKLQDNNEFMQWFYGYWQQ